MKIAMYFNGKRITDLSELDWFEHVAKKHMRFFRRFIRDEYEDLAGIVFNVDEVNQYAEDVYIIKFVVCEDGAHVDFASYLYNIDLEEIMLTIIENMVC